MAEVNLVDLVTPPAEPLTKEHMSAALAAPDPEFDAWVASMPDPYWSRYDLSACKLGWMAGRQALTAEYRGALFGPDPLQP